MTYPIHYVEWDSKFFDYPVGLLEITHSFDQQTFHETLRQGQSQYRLIYVGMEEKTPEDRGPEELPTADKPCLCYDRKVLLRKEIEENVPPVKPKIKPYTSTTCTKPIERLAIRSGVMTRFKRDPELSPQFERLFLTWINNSVTGGLADSIWTWSEGERPVGLATVRCAKRIDRQTGQSVREGHIGMLAVDDEFVGQDIASGLIQACEFWCDSVDVPYSAIFITEENESLISHCLRLDYKKMFSESIYHYWSPHWVYDARHGWLHNPAVKS